jgi:hypothetical protein
MISVFFSGVLSTPWWLIANDLVDAHQLIEVFAGLTWYVTPNTELSTTRFNYSVLITNTTQVLP